MWILLESSYPWLSIFYGSLKLGWGNAELAGILC